MAKRTTSRRSSLRDILARLHEIDPPDLPPRPKCSLCDAPIEADEGGKVCEGCREGFRAAFGTDAPNWTLPPIARSVPGRPATIDGESPWQAKAIREMEDRP